MAQLRDNGPKSSGNLADEVQRLMSRLTDPDEDFVRSVCVQLHQPPAIVLFTQNQIDDLRSLCSRECIPSLRSVLSVDRTFNLSSLFVTLMVFKNKRVVRRSSQEPPIFVGPLMLHGDGKLSTYLHFFTTVNAALNGTVVDSSELVCDGVVTGSDEEQAIVAAANIAFPNSKHLFCMLHCKDNVRHQLSTIGVPTTVRESVLARLFGCNGISESPDEVTMDNRTAELMQYVRQTNVDAVAYLQERILPKIVANNRHKWTEQWIGHHQWSNNNAESANHLLKLQVCIIMRLGQITLLCAPTRHLTYRQTNRWIIMAQQ